MAASVEDFPEPSGMDQNKRRLFRKFSDDRRKPIARSSDYKDRAKDRRPPPLIKKVARKTERTLDAKGKIQLQIFSTRASGVG